MSPGPVFPTSAPRSVRGFCEPIVGPCHGGCLCGGQGWRPRVWVVVEGGMFPGELCGRLKDALGTSGWDLGADWWGGFRLGLGRPHGQEGPHESCLCAEVDAGFVGLGIG